MGSVSSRRRVLASCRRYVLLLVDTSRAYGRGVVQGVLRYNREHGLWRIYFKPHGLGDPPPPWLRESAADGILARIGTAKMAQAILQAKVPAVDLRGVIPDTGLPTVRVDNREVARLAVEHFLDRGFERFGFCGLPRGVNPHMDELCDQFVVQLDRIGFECDVFQARRGPRNGEAWERQQSRMEQWKDQQSGIASWIQRLRKPVAVMACHDDRALQVLDACHRIGATVPEQLALLSSDNDEYLCELADPPLTSIDENAVRVGYEAAALLDRMMDRKPLAMMEWLVPPLGVVTRQTTDMLAVEDSLVADALQFIRNHACDGIRPTDVVARACVSRVTLALRFKAALGRSIGDEIHRVQVSCARTLLAKTELPIKQIAHRAGFRSVAYMTRLFGRLTGQTPGECRKQTGLR